MIETGIDRRIKVKDILQNQLPKFILDESPDTVDFLKQYYISQEYQGGPTDLSNNLDQYLNIDNLTPEVIVDSVTLSDNITSTDTEITVKNLSVIETETIDKGTKGFPNSYGLLKIGNEVITYTGITTNTFTGCIRGFSGITSYHQTLDNEELIFTDSSVEEHTANVPVQNLSSLFLKEFYKKFKYTFVPGLEDDTFYENLNVGNFIKEAKSLYETKGTDESFRILFNVLYGITPDIINLEEYLIKPSSANYLRRQVAVAEAISGNPLLLEGQTLFKTNFNPDINASISEVEPFTRNNKQYYKFSLFLGYDNYSDIEGNFLVIPNTKCLDKVNPDSKIISVDSTIGFSTSGNITSGINSITYTDKTVNQFLNCSGITSTILPTDSVRGNDLYFGYENGDINNKVELRFSAVLSKFVQTGIVDVDENDIISVKHVGDKILNPINKTKTYKQIFANSWIYNTSSSYDIEEGSITSPLKVTSDIDRSSLKYGDKIEIVDTYSDQVIYPVDNDDIPFVSQPIDNGTNEISLENFSADLSPSGKYKIRRKINKARSSITPIEFGNDNIISDIQNVYTSSDDEYAYTASNSLPSYVTNINENNQDILFPYSRIVDSEIQKYSINLLNENGNIGNYNSLTEKYSSLTFPIDTKFVTGDKIYYESDGAPLVGLETGIYYIEKIGPKTIKLFGSRSGIETSSNGLNQYLEFTPALSGDGGHNFTLYSQKSNKIIPQKLFKKFSLSSKIASGIGETTQPGGIGMLINGVEISNYKALDRIYYGPLSSINILSGGSNYDVINPPRLNIETSNGTTALSQLVVSGTVKDVLVDPQEFDIDKVISIGVTGGNGRGCSLEPIITKRYRETLFDARLKSEGGGIRTESELTDPNTILFDKDHGFLDGQEVIYDSNGNTGVGIGNTILLNNATYYTKYINNRTISLYESSSDYVAGINTLAFNGLNNSGTHKLKIGPTNTLSGVTILNNGEGYANRKLIVKSSGISSESNSIIFKNHGFNNGDKVVYSTDGSIITGLSTENQYQVIKIDNNSFKLANAGLGGTDITNYQRKNYVNLTSSGSGYHNFSYPPIKGFVKFISVGIGTTTIEVTPVVKGSITDAYLYESGTGYGSTILNYERKPNIIIQNGKEASVTPIISNGQFSSVNVQLGGTEYYSTPDLEIIDASGSGTGAKLRAIVNDIGNITDVIVVSPGIGYSDLSTSIVVKSSGINGKIDSSIRQLTVNNKEKYGQETLFDSGSGLKYSVCGYSTNLFNFGDSSNKVSPIIGWSYDGNPIYGPYGKSNADGTGLTKQLESSYVLNTSNVIDRPSTNMYEAGYFVEDYQYNESGDLDEHNGRYEKNEDFPNGVYAYHALVDSLDSSVFPYFIGNTYRSKIIEENFQQVDQSFDFNNSNLRRNTFPYKVSDLNANNDFIVETYENTNQKIEVKSVVSGSINGFDIIGAGVSFKVNDSLIFDETDTEGSGLDLRVSEINGKDIVKLDTSIESYNDAILTWKENEVQVSILPSHNLNDGDSVIISGISTFLTNLNGSHTIGISSYTSRCIATVTESPDPLPSSGFTTEIYVSNIPKSVSIGSSALVGVETVRILDIYENLKILRVLRSSAGIAHSDSTLIQYLPDSFSIPTKISQFDSELGFKVYFNADESIGIGTTSGISYPVSFEFGGNNISRNIPTQSIYIENHPFENNQKVTLSAPVNSSDIGISTLPDTNVFDLVSAGNSTVVYIVKKSPNTIGIKTGIDKIGTVDPAYSEVYFRQVSGGLGGDNDQYLLEYVPDKVTAKVERIKTAVTLSTSHQLAVNDVVNLNVNPGLSTGIYDDISVIVKRDSFTGNILVNPISFNSGSVQTDNLNLSDHKLTTGQLIYYNGHATGLSTGKYYVYKVDDDNIQLGKTRFDVINDNTKIISITASTGGVNQSISLINPPLLSHKNNNLLFDLSDASLIGYDFKIYYDKDFQNEFISMGSSTTFNVLEDTNSLTVNYSEDLPPYLYYNIEKSGFISTCDTDVVNYSQITYINSDYTGSYKIAGIGTTTFDIFLNNKPSTLSYISSDCDILNYSTKSTSEVGSINNIDIFSSGSGYKKLPSYVGSSSSISKDAIISLKSSNIGNINEVRIINEGYEYSFDKTLEPEAYISPIIKIKNSNTIGIVSVISGGSGYDVPPVIHIVDTNTGQKIDSGLLEANLLANSIIDVSIEELPVGIPNDGVQLFTVDNTNGISVEQVISAQNSGIFTCIVQTPILGFSTTPFRIGDKVYVEGIQKYSTDGSGFNSDEHGYNFFEVIGPSNIENIQSNNPYNVEFNITGLTTNTGIAKTVQDSFGILINKTTYPEFDLTIDSSPLSIGEQLIVNNKLRDLYVSHYNNDIVKVSGTYEVSIGDILLGNESGNTAEIDKLIHNKGKFITDFSVKKDIGWSDDIGKISLDNQVIPNNDYYQNLSYSVKSPIQWRDLQSPVNNLLHTSGLKNFADTGITSTTAISVGSSNPISITVDIIEDHRVDEVRNLDMAIDYDVTNDVSKFVQFENIRLSNYVTCKSNEVLVIDDINKQFSNLDGDPSYYLNISDANRSSIYDNFLVRISSNGYSTNQMQLSEVIVIGNGDTNVLFDKGSLVGSGIGFTSLLEDEFGSFAIVDDGASTFLRFIPNNPYDIDYDLKILSSKFNSTISGFGSVSLGAVDLNTYVGTFTPGLTDDIISVGISSFNSLILTGQVIDDVTKQMNFVESYITIENGNTYVSEYYVDSLEGESDQIGRFIPSVSSDSLTIQYENNTSNSVSINSRIVGFGTTGAGNGEHRFKTDTQTDGSERSVVYQGITTAGVGTTTIVSLDKNLFDSFKSLVEVSIGASKAIHELRGVQKDSDLYLQQSQYLSIGNDDQQSGRSVLSTGLGTFGLSYEASNFILTFYPDDLIGVSTVTSFNQLLYTTVDTDNTYDPYTYGKISDKVDIQLYNAINGNRINRLDFKLNSNSVPIFAKTFNPANTNIVDFVTGKFTIEKHFFNSNEELIYTPKSTFVGVGSTPMLYRNASANIIAELPSTVFAIKENDNIFQIATTRAGTAVTFMDVGEGNAHQFAMAKRNEKSIISIDNIGQYPLIPTNISHSIEYNLESGISTSDTLFSLSGISTLTVDKLLKVGNEYMSITNVGIGTSTVGPITPGIGTYPLVEVRRGFVGSSATNYSNGTVATLYKGSYNIVDSTIWFTKAPRGNPQGLELNTGLPFVRSYFNGRAFLRKDYSTNVVYDDISPQFTGLTSDFTLKVGGADTVGIGTSGGNGILFLNNIFQRPTTDNNPSNNFKIIEDTSAGISTVIFSGITSTDGSLIVSDSDVNQNQLPRGGVIVSLGSTNGLGYAPLIGANVNPVLDVNGSITSVVGIATTGRSLGIQTAEYNKVTGIMTVTTEIGHDFAFGEQHEHEVKLERLEFACTGSYGLTTTFFPETSNDTYAIVGVGSTNTFEVNVGTSTITHEYVGSGTAYPWYGDLTFGSGYNNIISIGVTVIDPGYEHKFVSSDNNSITVNANGINPSSNFTPTDASYDPVSGELVLTKESHGTITYDSHKAISGTKYNGAVGILTVKLQSTPSPALAVGQLVNIAGYGITFTCAQDGDQTNHAYPRVGDPIYNKWVPINVVTGGDQFEIQVLDNIPSTNVTEHVFVSGLENGIKRTTNNITVDQTSLTFTCSKDNHLTEHLYPRSTDPLISVSSGTTSIVEATADTITINVGSNVGSGANITAHPIGINTHQFLSALSNAVITVTSGYTDPTNLQPFSGTEYDPATGDLTLNFPGHSFTTNDTIQLTNNGIVFACAQDNYSTKHSYPRSTDPIAGITTEVTVIDGNNVKINVGKSVNGSGGALNYEIVSGGTKYQKPNIFTSQPSYSNLEVRGVSRLSKGATTDTGNALLVDVNVGPSNTTGIGSGFFEVSDFQVARYGYGFERGDIFEPIGLVTDRKISEVYSKFTLEATDVYSDEFALWQFGEMDYIDSIEYLQNGTRSRFPLYYNGELISIEASQEFNSDLANVLVVVRNGVIQEPISAYDFVGGTSIIFSTPPRGASIDEKGYYTSPDKISIFFYKGTDGVDATISIPESVDLEVGDNIQLKENETVSQNQRTVYEVTQSDRVATNLYNGPGIVTFTSNEYKPVSVFKQKVDKILNLGYTPKTRDKMEPLVLPTAKIIQDFSTTDTEFYVDDATIFNYEQKTTPTFGGIIVAGTSDPVAAGITAIVSTSSTIQSLDIVSGGEGYISTPIVSISAPPSIGVGIGTTATATVSISNGAVNAYSITNPGYGYTIAPNVLCSIPEPSYEVMTGNNVNVQSISGIITGITTTTVSSDLAIEFVAISTVSAGFDLVDAVGDPIYIFDTVTGTGVTSMDVSGDHVVGLGTTFSDNVYEVLEFSKRGNPPEVLGIITCKIHSDTNTVGFGTTGSILNPVGKYSCGLINNFVRSSSPISIAVTGRTVDVGLTTFPTLQRRGGDDTWDKTGGIARNNVSP